MEQPQRCLDQVEEHAHYANDEVVLRVASVESAVVTFVIMTLDGFCYVQGTPDQWNGNGSIVCKRIQDGAWIGIEAPLTPLFPQNGAIQVWRCDAEESKIGDGKGQLKDHEEPDDIGQSPRARNEEATHVGRVARW